MEKMGNFMGEMFPLLNFLSVLFVVVIGAFGLLVLVVFILDVSPEEAYRRIQQTRTKQEMFETLDHLQKIRQKAFDLALIGKWTIIDANQSIKDIIIEIRNTALSGDA